MKQNTFAAKVSDYLKVAGRTKDTLAKSLSLHPATFSRKLNQAKDTNFNHAEVKLIVRMLAEWDSFNSQAQALELLELHNCPDFTPEEWNSPPLNRLEPTNTLPLISPRNTTLSQGALSYL